ncbi:MAG: glycosyltransferase [Gammaproteobacteria bacterium]|nr:glycosyltransferase [Gammaproteobacteria bacterium]
MRIVIDMQGAQSESRFRGIGRYSLSFALAVARNAGEHEIWLALNGNFPDSVGDIRQAFADLLPAERIRTFQVPDAVAEMNPGTGWRTRVAELVREHFLDALNPDVIVVTSLFEGHVDDVVTSIGTLPTAAKTASIQYDLIPVASPDRYLPETKQKYYYFRKIDSLKRADLLLAISQSSREEAIALLPVSGEKVVNVSSAVDERFRRLVVPDEEAARLRRQYGIRGNFILYVPGGFDRRKNFDGLMRAYTMLTPQLRSAYQLVIASKVTEGSRENLLYLRNAVGMDESELVITGYVSDEDLVSIYNLTSLFVFPSLHEGFGLPVLEAMACGAPVIGSNTTSIPEVVGREDALFDPHSPASIAERIAQVLTDQDFREELMDYGLERSRIFSWDTTARAAIAAIEERFCAGLHSSSEDWREILGKREESYRSLVEHVARVVVPDFQPTERDLRDLARSIAANLQQIDRLVRKRELPEHISWRLEGPFESSYSLSIVNREIARALVELGHRVVIDLVDGGQKLVAGKDFPRSHPDLAEFYRNSAAYPQESVDVTSRNSYPPHVDNMVSRMNFLHQYAWEESGFPMGWVDSFNQSLQGITCTSEHVRKTLIDNGVGVPMRVIWNGVDHWEKLPAAASVLEEDESFRFLHVSSCFPRKGVDVLLSAYGEAFTADDAVTLIIKTFPNPHNRIHQQLAEVRKNNPHYPKVILIEEALSDSRLKGLYEVCHALVAPSRAEGFGLPMAEAMLSGLPVITTGWGGQCDFCTEETSWLVDYSFVPAESHIGVFDSVWAEPDVGHLASLMRQLAAMPKDDARKKSLQGRNILLERFKWTDVARRMLDAANWFSSECDVVQQKVGWISTWNVRCGIAAYSKHLIENMRAEVTVLAAHGSSRIALDSPNVHRCWETGENDTLEELSMLIDKQALDTLVIQFNYGFFDFPRFSIFLKGQVAAGRIVVVMLHATTDPKGRDDKRLASLASAFSRCHRILVHTPSDLNRMKSLGLVNNVAVFPHGIVDYNKPAGTAAPTGRFTIASYGFFLPHKGLLELIEAVKLLRNDGVDVSLRMVNAEYPVDDSRRLVETARKRIAALGMDEYISMTTEYLEDEASLALLSQADLIVFPYQETGESSSAAVRYGLATGCPVAVTPLTIFDDVSMAVYKLPGTRPEAIAEGINRILTDADNQAEQVRTKAQQWREIHRYSVVGRRLSGMLEGLKINLKF